MGHKEQIDYFIDETDMYYLNVFARNNANLTSLMGDIMYHPKCTRLKKKIIFDALCRKAYDAVAFLHAYRELATEEFIDDTVDAMIRDKVSLIGGLESDIFNKDQKDRLLTAICSSKMELHTLLIDEMHYKDYRKDILRLTLDNGILVSALYIYENKYGFSMRVYEYNKIEQMAVMAKLAGF